MKKLRKSRIITYLSLLSTILYIYILRLPIITNNKYFSFKFFLFIVN